MNELPLPDFYDLAGARSFDYAPDQQRLFELAERWRTTHAIAPSIDDRRKLHLLLIDVQKDFCFPEGTLYVGGRSGTGAVEDNDRLARFIYRNLDRITDVTCTLDTHFPYQIFFPWFWRDADDRPLRAHREISADEIRAGAVRPNPVVADWLAGGDRDWLRRQVEFYCDELERAGKYRLYLWPPHCLLGSAGHALAGVIHEARLFHAWVRGSRASIEIKGSHPLTENYSALAPEVRVTFDGRELGRLQERFVATLREADAVIVAGQAASHCVKSTIEDLLERTSPAQRARVYVLEDCMSAVAVPDPGREGAFLFDFTEQAEEALRGFADAGAHVVRSTDPLHAWPGLG
jgi:nicotinamidase-related amidase